MLLLLFSHFFQSFANWDGLFRVWLFQLARKYQKPCDKSELLLLSSCKQRPRGWAASQRTSQPTFATRRFKDHCGKLASFERCSAQNIIHVNQNGEVTYKFTHGAGTQVEHERRGHICGLWSGHWSHGCVLPRILVGSDKWNAATTHFGVKIKTRSLGTTARIAVRLEATEDDYRGPLLLDEYQSC